MSYDFGFTLKNRNNPDFSLDLISFCGRNMSKVCDRLKWNSKEVKEEVGNAKVEIDFNTLYDFGEKLKRITDIFHGVSDREKEYDLYSKRVDKLYADLLYDLEVEYDSVIIFSLERLDTFIQFLQTSDLFDEFITDNKDNYLVMWESY